MGATAHSAVTLADLVDGRPAPGIFRLRRFAAV